MIRSNLEIVIGADTQEKGDAALRKMEKRFLNSVMQGKLVLSVKVIGKSNDPTTSWSDESSEGNEPWK